MRIVLAAILGGIALFMWGFVYWTGISQSFSAIRSLDRASETAIVESLKTHMPRDGVYFIPGFPEHDSTISAEEKQRLDDDWNVRHEDGPTGMIVYRREGAKAMMTQQFMQGLVINIISAFFVACLVSVGGRRFLGRYAMVVCFGIASAVAIHGAQWNWFRMPSDYTLFMVADVLGGWIVAGLVIAAIVGNNTRTAPTPPAKPAE